MGLDLGSVRGKKEGGYNASNINWTRNLFNLLFSSRCRMVHSSLYQFYHRSMGFLNCWSYFLSHRNNPWNWILVRCMVDSIDEVTFNSNDLLFYDRRVFTPVPEYWSRIELTDRRNWNSHDEISLTEWIHNHVGGLWSVHSYEFLDNSTDKKSHYTRKRQIRVVISFEDPNDKLMFQMMGGVDAVS